MEARGTEVVAVVVAVVLGAAGCADEPPQPEGPSYQYVMSELRVPTSNAMAHANGLDLNGDRTVDNQLGMVFGALEGAGLGVAGTAHEAVLRGGAILLAELQTLSFDDVATAGLTTYLGDDPDPAPCLDPARLETCGQHLLGGGRFSVEPGSASALAVGPIEAGVFAAGADRLPVEIAVDVAAPIRLDLHGARVRLSSISEGHVTGVLAGVIVQADLDAVVIPQIALQMQRIVSAECGQPGGVTPCGCLGGERAELLQKYFDADDDCAITLDEARTNSIVQSLLAPDVRIGDDEGISFGVGVELVPAVFDPPAGAAP